MGYANSTPLSTQDIPVIDVGPLRDGSDLASVGGRLAWAASDVGFIYIENHGVARSIVERARQSAREFFGRPLEDKLEAGTNRYHHGYLRPGATKMYDDARVDLKESFNWGLELDAGSLAEESENPFIGPNVWPEFMPGFKDAVYPFFEAASRCAEALLRGFAAAANLPEDVFLARSDRPISRGSLQYYPPQPPDLGEEQFGVAPHTDFGVLTVLCQDEVGGLQIQGPNGKWVAVPPIADTFVVNVGDLLERWSNGRYRSTAHRVINTSGRERLSLVLAYDPNFETLVDPRVFCAEGERPKYDPITCGEYLMRRFRRAFAYRATE